MSKINIFFKAKVDLETKRFKGPDYVGPSLGDLGSSNFENPNSMIFEAT